MLALITGIKKTMPKSVYQSVTLVRNGVSTLLPQFELCPILPDEYDSTRTEDGSIIEVGNMTKKILPNGDIKVYMPKPTYQDCFNSHSTGAFYQFNADDSILMRVGGETYYWSAPVDTNYEDIYISCRV